MKGIWEAWVQQGREGGADAWRSILARPDADEDDDQDTLGYHASNKRPRSSEGEGGGGGAQQR